jgi:flagellin FlaB
VFNKALKTFGKVYRGERGMTGLETAIILIAFVTVAAVFGYAVLSAGLFSAERGKETIYAGLDQARSNMETVGSVICTSTDNSTVATVKFAVKNSIAGKPIDMTPQDGNNLNKTIVSVAGADFYSNDVKWTCTPVGTTNGNYILEAGEQFEIEVDFTDLGGTFTDPGLAKYDTFTVQVKPALGSSLTIERTLPSGIQAVIDLH